MHINKQRMNAFEKQSLIIPIPRDPRVAAPITGGGLGFLAGAGLGGGIGHLLRPHKDLEEPAWAQEEEWPEQLSEEQWAELEDYWQKHQENEQRQGLGVLIGGGLGAIPGGIAGYHLGQKMAKDKLPGGLADNKSNAKYEAEELAEGAETELEHTDNFDTSVEIAKDHLEEHPDYYTRLENMEERAEAGMPPAPAPKEKEAMYIKGYKEAGYWSEMASMANPLNLYGGGLIGGAAALMNPTRDLEEQAQHDAGGFGQAMKNILIPGVGPYHAMKRVGHSIRGPELVDRKNEIRQERREAKRKPKEDRKKRDEERANKQEPAMDNNKAASFNALNVADYLMDKIARGGPGCKKKGKKMKKKAQGGFAPAKKRGPEALLDRNPNVRGGPIGRAQRGQAQAGAKPGLKAMGQPQQPKTVQGPVNMGHMMWDSMLGRNRRYK